MATSNFDQDAKTELFELPEQTEEEKVDPPEPEEDELAEVPTQPIALFELPPSKR